MQIIVPGQEIFDLTRRYSITFRESERGGVVRFLDYESDEIELFEIVKNLEDAKNIEDSDVYVFQEEPSGAIIFFDKRGVLCGKIKIQADEESSSLNIIFMYLNIGDRQNFVLMDDVHFRVCEKKYLEFYDEDGFFIDHRGRCFYVDEKDRMFEFEYRPCEKVLSKIYLGGESSLI